MGLLACALACAGAPASICTPVAQGDAGWHSEQPPPPTPSPGQGSVGAPIPLGHIGDIEFWAPNRGLLITAGNEAVPAGLYAYDGVSWHELSTVCGGADGRIAWAGPDDFWTIADQQTGQQLQFGTNVEAELRDRSLCHFVNGQVVASYAEPIGVPNSYQPMDAAACSGPSDCWFAGGRLASGVNEGAFHLHWDGHSLSALPSLETPEPRLEDAGRDVAGLIDYKGRFYESVQVRQGDQAAGSESSSQPYLIHRIAEGSSNPFVGLAIEGPAPGHPFNYGEAGVAPWQLSAFRFSGDPEGLWAIAGPDGLAPSAPGAPAAAVTAALLGSEGFHQLALSDPSGVFLPGYQVEGLAAEPGTGDAWVSIAAPGEVAVPGEASRPGPVARIARIHPDGTVEAEDQLPGAGEGLAHKGAATAIACPAQGDCWMATSTGWLFHLGASHPRDTDPSFQSLITYRPPDAGVPFVAPDEAPEDDSGSNPPPLPPPPQPPSASHLPRAHEPLFSHLTERVSHGTTLLVTFTLATSSRVRLLAFRRHRTVAATKRLVLARGHHRLTLRLSRRAWPTRLDLQVHALGKVPLLPAEASGESLVGGGPTAVTTTVRLP